MRKRALSERIADQANDDAESKARLKRGEITKDQYKAEVKDNKKRADRKTAPMEVSAPESTQDESATGRLAKLQAMLEDGVITESEYQSQREAIISEV